MKFVIKYQSNQTFQLIQCQLQKLSYLNLDLFLLLTLSASITEKERKSALIFIFTLLYGASKSFIKVLDVFKEV